MRMNAKDGAGSTKSTQYKSEAGMAGGDVHIIISIS